MTSPPAGVVLEHHAGMTFAPDAQQDPSADRGQPGGVRGPWPQPSPVPSPAERFCQEGVDRVVHGVRDSVGPERLGSSSLASLPHARPPVASATVDELQARPFYGYGYRRVHVYTPDDRHVGWFDPNSGTTVLELEEFRGGFEATMATWAAEHPKPAASAR
jgi:hypothetical protein